MVGLFFSANWCPPCQGFVPKLAETYGLIEKKLAQRRGSSGGKEGGFEVVFVSSCREEEGFSAFYETMPWLALPYSDRARKATLSQQLGIKVCGLTRIACVMITFVLCFHFQSRFNPPPLRIRHSTCTGPPHAGTLRWRYREALDERRPGRGHPGPNRRALSLGCHNEQSFVIAIIILKGAII